MQLTNNRGTASPNFNDMNHLMKQGMIYQILKEKFVICLQQHQHLSRHQQIIQLLYLLTILFQHHLDDTITGARSPALSQISELSCNKDNANSDSIECDESLNKVYYINMEIIK